MDVAAQGPEAVAEHLDRELIDVFVQAGQALGLPKSVGGIYGLLYVSTQPLSMDDITRKLGISLGSASQGLKHLKAFRAVQAEMLPGQRREFYSAETEFRKLLIGFFREEMLPQLEAVELKLDELRPLLRELPSSSREHYKGRLSRLHRWRGKTATILSRVVRLVTF